MSLVGMDVDVVKGIGRDLHTQAQAIQTSINAINKLLDNAKQNWKGKDSDHFEQLWHGQYQGQLRKIQSDIEDLGKAAVKNAGEQERTSSSY
jgi:uncharacterized protein YukE